MASKPLPGTPSVASPGKAVPRSKGGTRNTQSAELVTKAYAAKLLGVNVKTLHDWQAKGCPAFVPGGVNLGLLTLWERDLGRAEGLEGARMEAATTGEMTVADIDREIAYHKLLDVKMDWAIKRDRYVLKQVVKANTGRMLGRMVAMLRQLPMAIDAELELAASPRERREIYNTGLDAIIGMMRVDAIINGDDDGDLETQVMADVTLEEGAPVSEDDSDAQALRDALEDADA